MVRLSLVLVVLFGACLAEANVQANDAAIGANPVRKIVTLMQEMQKEIEESGEKEQELYDKFMCYCETTTTDLSSARDQSDSSIKEFSATLEESKAEKAQIDQELAEHKSDREAAKADLAKATAIREKEAEAFAATEADSTVNIGALSASIPAIEKGMGGAALMQVPASKPLLKLVESSASLSQIDKERVSSFLSGKDEEEYAPQSGQIVGILKTMKDEMEANYAGAQKDEASSAAAFADLKAAKTNEIQLASDAIETKGARSGTLAVTIVETQSALDDAETEKADAEKYLASLASACTEKTKEWTARQGLRAQEVSAISEAISILNDDDALDIFKKAAPAVFVETKVSEAKRRQMGFLALPSGKASRLQKAQAIVSSISAIYKSTQLELLSFNLKAALKRGLSKQTQPEEMGSVTGIIDDMIEVLKAEGKDDEKHRDWCKEELQTTEEEKLTVQDKADSLASAVSELEDQIKTVGDEIGTLEDEITKMDASVALATINRKKEHAEYTESLTLSEAAIQLLEKAKNRLNKFYNPALYKAPPKKELSEEDAIYTSMGGKLEEAPAFVQINEHKAKKVVPPVPPETFGAYQPAGGKSGGVMALMDNLTKELQADVAQAKHDEEMAQKEYDDLMTESRDTRASNSKSIVDKEATKANLGANLEDVKESQSVTLEELDQVHTYLGETHSSCDFILANFDLRRQARDTELESLGNAKAVLAGANFSG